MTASAQDVILLVFLARPPGETCRPPAGGLSLSCGGAGQFARFRGTVAGDRGHARLTVFMEQRAVSTDEDTLKRRYREFLELMPLTVAIAGLPTSEPPYNYNADQLEVRTRTLLAAYKLARQVAKEAITGG